VRADSVFLSPLSGLDHEWIAVARAARLVDLDREHVPARARTRQIPEGGLPRVVQALKLAAPR
jgi:hypothetical protein